MNNGRQHRQVTGSLFQKSGIHKLPTEPRMRKESQKGKHRSTQAHHCQNHNTQEKDLNTSEYSIATYPRLKKRMHPGHLRHVHPESPLQMDALCTFQVAILCAHTFTYPTKKAVITKQCPVSQHR